MTARVQLDSKQVIHTVETLLQRIRDRFPKSGLYQVGEEVLRSARAADATAEAIARPYLGLRLAAAGAAALLVCVLTLAARNLEWGDQTSLSSLIATVEAATNEIIMLGLGVWFLWSLELRWKRRKVIRAVNRLRDLAHIIDMHQLTKDPDGVAEVSHPTAHSPRREMTAWELGRYLDYCTELLALLSKLAYLSVQRFDDPEATEAVNDLETLSVGLSRKIWQKIAILRTQHRNA